MATNGYQLSRVWFDFSFENPDLISVNDTALYFTLIEINNRCGWKEKFSITAKQCMEGAGFNTYPPYKKALNKLIELGFVKLVKHSANQYQSTIIALSKINKATEKAFDKALLNHSTKHLSYSLNPKPLTIETANSAAVDVFKKAKPGYPTESEVKEFFLKAGYLESIAVKAFHYYDDENWVDSKGNKVRDWKRKMKNVWFKDEHKIQPQKERGLVY